jgi:hypothetical protein
MAMALRWFCAFCLSLLAQVASAQGPSGTWIAEVDGPQGRFPLVFELSAQGERLTGTVSNDWLPKFPLQNGSVSGNQIFFELPMRDVTLAYTGTLSGDEIALVSRVLEERPSAGGQTLGGVLRTVKALKATRAVGKTRPP